MSTPFDGLRSMYAREFSIHGDAPAALFTPKGRHHERYRVVEPYVRSPGARILDYGCGLGYFYQYLRDRGVQADYTGTDLVPEFVDACRKKFGSATARFEVAAPTAAIGGEYDVVFLSGVFNLKLGGDAAASRAYTFQRLQELFAVTRGVLICDFLSSLVDFQQPDAMHFSVGEIADFCGRQLSRRFLLRHDLLPYEFTLIVHRDSAIRRPENIYQADHDSAPPSPR